MKYRPHREYLTDSMKEVMTFDTKEEFREYLGNPPFDTIIFEYQGYDRRIGWISYLVSVNGVAVGHSDSII